MVFDDCCGGDERFVNVSHERRTYINERINQERVIPIVSSTGDVRGSLRDIVSGLRESGLSVVEITCRSPMWREHLEILRTYREKDAGLVIALGTNTYVYSVHEGIEGGAEVILAANSLPRYRNFYAIPQNRRFREEGFSEFVGRHLGVLEEFMLGGNDSGSVGDFVRDPVWYAKSRGAVVIPAAPTIDGLNCLRKNGADYQKLFPANNYTLAQLEGMLKTVTEEDDLRIIPTGGINLRNAGQILNLPHVAAVGASLIVGEGYRDTLEKSREFLNSIK